MGGEEQASFPRFKTEGGWQRYLGAYEAALRDWPVPYQELDVPTHLGPTHLIASGPADAPPLILLPSFAGTALVWRPNVEALSREWRVLAVDVIGQPGKSLARRRIRDRRDYGRWLAGVLDHLGVAKASFVGCSFGGFLAASQALLTPDRVDRLVLIGPVGVFASMSWTLAVLMRTARLRRRIRGLFGDRRPPDPATLHAAAVPLHPKDAAWRALMGVTMAEAPTVSITRAKVFSRAELRRITAPMLLLIGEHERLYDARATLKLALVLKPGLQAEIVEAADHIAAMAQPERVNPQIAGFLRGSAALS